ncbi:MAG: glutamine amidotransferase [Pelagibacterales bacterium MED-G42]|nr:MAG: glutamine amidotransferase [Pelagibacterales bacterium MED-G42]
MKKILLVEGNLREENQSFTDGGIKTHTESLKDSISFFTNKLELDVVNPSSDKNLSEVTEDLTKYDGMIWGGSSLNIYNDTVEIRRQLDFMRECQKKIKNILAICWGLQVAVTVAGGIVKRCNKGAHRGIAHNVKINKNGLTHPLYKNKNETFNTPAFNFDEVATLPNNSTLLSSNEINNVMGINFKCGVSDIWGIQYHPEITYDKMITLIHFRKDRLLNNKAFIDEDEINSHVKMIAEENKITNKDNRMKELENWLNKII